MGVCMSYTGIIVTIHALLQQNITMVTKTMQVRTPEPIMRKDLSYASFLIMGFCEGQNGIISNWTMVICFRAQVGWSFLDGKLKNCIFQMMMLRHIQPMMTIIWHSALPSAL